jgi:hypothetical protein
MGDVLMAILGITNQRALECPLTKSSYNIMHTVWISMVTGAGFVTVQDGRNALTGLTVKSFINEL